MSNTELALETLQKMRKKRFASSAPVIKVPYEEQILAHLLAYGTITPADAYRLYGCMRLGARIHDLRKKGILIHTWRMPNKRGGTYARYTLE